MDTELFDNLTDSSENSTFDPNDTYTFPTYYYVEIPTAIVAVLSSIANAIIVFTAIRCNELHTRLYFYLANWCTCNFVITASAHSILNSLGFAETMSSTALCIWSEIGFVFMYGNLMFVAVLVLDWYIMTFSNQSYCALNCRRFYKIIAGCIWISMLVLLVKAILYCLDFISIPLLILLVCLCYLSVTVLILVIWILRVIKLRMSSVVVEKSNIEFKIALSHFLCWFPNIIFITCHVAFHMTFVMEYVSYIIWYSNASIIFLILYFNDENFRACLGKLFNVKFGASRKNNKDIPLITI